MCMSTLYNSQTLYSVWFPIVRECKYTLTLRKRVHLRVSSFFVYTHMSWQAKRALHSTVHDASEWDSRHLCLEIWNWRRFGPCRWCVRDTFGWFRWQIKYHRKKTSKRAEAKRFLDASDIYLNWRLTTLFIWKSSQPSVNRPSAHSHAWHNKFVYSIDFLIMHRIDIEAREFLWAEIRVPIRWRLIWYISRGILTTVSSCLHGAHCRQSCRVMSFDQN